MCLSVHQKTDKLAKSGDSVKKVHSVKIMKLEAPVYIYLKYIFFALRQAYTKFTLYFSFLLIKNNSPHHVVYI